MLLLLKKLRSRLLESEDEEDKVAPGALRSASINAVRLPRLEWPERLPLFLRLGFRLSFLCLLLFNAATDGVDFVEFVSWFEALASSESAGLHLLLDG